MQQRPEAYVFDVYGTVVNWRHSLAKGLEASARKVIEEPSSGVDEAILTRAKDMTFSTRDTSTPMRGPRKAMGRRERPRSFSQEELHQRNLETLISEFKLDGLWTTPEQTDQLVHLWHELDAWPDSAAAIARFAQLGPVTALSDGSIWGSDTCMAYKPDPSVYLGAVRKLGFEPADVALVAAHLGDLWGAKQCGLRALYIERPFEERYTEGEVEEARCAGWVDMWVAYEAGSGLLGVVEWLEAMGE
ncbi:haloacid dehalogenase [Apiospora phragmitis]|uniref:Haloacid dehalogenase n=1 Tax=Apiospora phragmitis TaxID=2905665 RepID=A0ABR1W6J1_9PEZI